MKNVLKTIFISLFVMLAVSCGGDLYQKTSISVTLPGANSRAAVTDQLDYVLTVTSETDTTAEPITKTGVTGDTLTVEVAVGTYTVDLKTYAEDDTEHAKLLYEATETGVEVVQNEEKSVTLYLKSVAADDDNTEDDKKEETTDVTEASLNGMTVKAVENGFEITVAHTAENTAWTWAKVTEKTSGTVYDLYNSISKLNNNESVTFTYPFVTKDTEYQFAFTNDDKTGEEYCTAVKAVGGSGPLDYSVFNTLVATLTNGDNQEHYVNVANLKAETTDFIKDYSNIQFFFKLWSGETDWSDTAWVYERDCTTTIPTDKPQLYYYNDLLTNGKFNFYDTKYEWDDLTTLDKALSARTNYFVEIGYYFNVDSSDQTGRFATKSILSTAVEYKKLTTAENTPAEEEKTEEVTEVTANGLTVKATDKGFEITVAHTSTNKTWTFAQVTENTTKTIYDLYPSLAKLNNNESVTFTYPLVAANSEYTFTLSNDDNNNEDAPNVTNSIKATAGDGTLDYTEYKKMTVSLTDGDYKQRYLNVANLTDSVTKIFANYATVEFAYKLYSSKADWSETEFAGERDCDITKTAATDYYKDLHDNGKINIFDTKYEWNDFDTLNAALSTYEDYWAQIFFYFTNDASVGRFATPYIQSELTAYTPVQHDGSTNITVGVAIPDFTVEGTSAIEYANKEYTYTATPKSGAFVTGTVFAWYINGCAIEGANSSTITINPVKLAGMQADSNILTCMVNYGDLLKSEYISLTSTGGFTIPEKIDTGIVLWNNGTSETRYLTETSELASTSDSATLGIKILSSVNSGESIKTPDISMTRESGTTEYAGAFCFDDATGDIYLTIFNASVTTIYKYSSDGTVSKFDGSVPGLASSMCVIGNNLYIFNKSASALYKYNLSNSSYTQVTYMDPYVKNSSSKLLSITSDGEYIYAISSDSTDSDGTVYSIQKVNSSGTQVKSVDFWTMDSTGGITSSDNITDYPLVKAGFSSSGFSINDIQVNCGYVYILFGDTVSMRGGLIQLDKATLASTAFAEDKSYVLGFYAAGNPLGNKETAYFSGAAKFIAKKPDVLVLSDESLIYSGGNGKDTNRVVTVDLTEGTLTGIDVDVTFDYHVASSAFKNYLAN